MARSTKFEEILETEFRWPRAGDLPFLSTECEQENATTTHEKDARFSAMIDGYKLGADCMVERSMEGTWERDVLVYPVIFNYRQFIELSLKWQLDNFGPAVEIEANWNTHDLSKLWYSFAGMLDAYGVPDPDGANDIVATVVAQFAKIDPNSSAYRYPVDNKGRKIPLSLEQLNLAQLRDVMNAVDGYFMGCDGWPRRNSRLQTPP